MTEINVDISVTINGPDGIRQISLSTDNVIGDNPRFFVKEMRRIATRLLGRLCAQLATDTGYGYSGQPVVQDYSHRLKRLSDEPDPSYNGEGSLDGIEVRTQAKDTSGFPERSGGGYMPRGFAMLHGLVDADGATEDDGPQVHPQQDTPKATQDDEEHVPFFSTEDDGTIGSGDDDVPPNAGSSS